MRNTEFEDFATKAIILMVGVGSWALLLVGPLRIPDLI
jgi:hypothetical protein